MQRYWISNQVMGWAWVTHFRQLKTIVDD